MGIFKISHSPPTLKLRRAGRKNAQESGNLAGEYSALGRGSAFAAAAGGLLAHQPVPAFQTALPAAHLGGKYIPFTGWTTYIYLSLFFYGLAAMYALPAQRFGRTLLAIGAIEIFHLIIFVLYPTTYPRPSGDTGYPLFEFLKIFDSPTNCFPSLHVAIPLFLALAIWRGGKKIGILFLLWAILLTVSTLTTKQHYLLDVFGGVVTALLGLLLI